MYFVMLNGPGEKITPLLGDNMNVLLFETVDEANTSADECGAAVSWGYDVYEVGAGVEQ